MEFWILGTFGFLLNSIFIANCVTLNNNISLTSNDTIATDVQIPQNIVEDVQPPQNTVADLQTIQHIVTDVVTPQTGITGAQTPQTILYSNIISDNYGPSSPRPVLNQSTQIRVAVGARPVSLINFFEKEQHINLRFYLRLQWIDETLTWNPDNHKGVSSIIVDTDDIWIPDTILMESIGETFREPNNLFAEVDYKGNVNWNNIVGTLTYCKLLIQYFPYDVQYCNITFTSWNYDFSQIDFYYLSEMTIKQQLEGFVVNGMWRLANIEIEHETYTFGCTNESCVAWPSIKFILEFDRTQASFFAANILLPCFLMSLMNLLVFLFPVESGEKISFVMTNVLTLVLFQQLVATMLPPSGEDTPIFSLHIFWMIIFGSISIVWTVFVIVLNFKRSPFPGWLYISLTSFRYIYYQLEFGKEEATARHRERLKKSQLKGNDKRGTGVNCNNIHNEDDLTGDYQGEMNPLTNSIERWTDDGVKIYKGPIHPIDIDENEYEEQNTSIQDKLRIIFCCHCGQMNATKFKIKKEKLSYDPKDPRLWQQTATLFDKLMSYVMVFLTILVYFILVVRFASHDPVAYRASHRTG